MNLVILEGFVGKTPELKHFDNGGTSVSFSLGTSEWVRKPGSSKSVSVTDWHQCVASGTVAEFICKHFQKGSPMLIKDGKTRTRKYTGRDGIERYITEIHIRTVDFPAGQSRAQDDDDEQAERSSTALDRGDEPPM